MSGSRRQGSQSSQLLGSSILAAASLPGQAIGARVSSAAELSGQVLGAQIPCAASSSGQVLGVQVFSVAISSGYMTGAQGSTASNLIHQTVGAQVPGAISPVASAVSGHSAAFSAQGVTGGQAPCAQGSGIGLLGQNHTQASGVSSAHASGLGAQLNLGHSQGEPLSGSSRAAVAEENLSLGIEHFGICQNWRRFMKVERRCQGLGSGLIGFTKPL